MKRTVSKAFKQGKMFVVGGQPLADEKGGCASAMKAGLMGIERPKQQGNVAGGDDPD